MKKLACLSSFLLLLIACQTNRSATPDAAKILVSDTTLRFKSIINGYWYQVSYIESIKKTKSPLNSQHFLAEHVELDIDTSETTGDSISIAASGIHEGINFVIYLKPGLTATSFPTNISDWETPSNFYELSYKITGNDTSLIIRRYNKEKKLIGQTKYMRTLKNSEGALQFMVNKTLFTGNYNAEDSSGKMSVLKFANDGLVTGLQGFKKYYVLTDFVAEPDDNIDEVCFDIQTNNQKCYAFEIEEDTIRLYDVKESAGQDSSIRGQFKYKLVKK